METNVVLAVLFWGCLLLGMPESRGQEAEWRKGTYPDGTLRYEGYFRAGKPAGEMKRYYPDGKLQARMVYRGDTVEAVLYSRKSDCSMRGKYVGRKKQGTWEYFKNDCLLMKEEYRDQVLNGKTVRFFSTGNPAEEKGWVNGKPEGEWKLYYDNGQLRMIAGLKAGKLDGEVKTYSYQGILRSEGRYRNDRKEGTWVFFDDSGVEVKRKNYRAGISDTAEEDELEESRYLDVLLSTVKKIPDPAVFADDPEGYMKLTGMEGLRRESNCQSLWENFRHFG